ncbi:MAG: SUMF1/EgtB/PvdO family nonheme iron enzyme [Pirellulales bacterium]|nr:SUMF1/EgtB/PvdO family nonheme iron enzyme [Pirellulales bacterium]
MRWRHTLLGLSVLLALDAQGQEPQKNIARDGSLAAQLEAGRKWAVLVGINKYLDPQIPSLRYCVSDARQLARALAESAGYEAERILLITDDQPEDHLQPLGINLRHQIRGWLKKAEPRDTVVVAFSGHGFLDERGQGFLAPKDCEKDSLGLTGFRIDDLRDMLHQCKASQKLLILDCCHSGGERSVEGVGASSRELGMAFQQAAGLITLASCDKNETSREWEAKSQGLFTYYLVEGLKGAADYDRNGVIDSYELHRYTLDQVSLTAQTKLNAQQTPKLLVGEDVKGVFALARVDRRPALPTRLQVDAEFTVREQDQNGPPSPGTTVELMYRKTAGAGAEILARGTTDSRGVARLTIWLEGNQQSQGEFLVLVASTNSSQSWPLKGFPKSRVWNLYVPQPLRPIKVVENSLGMKLVLLPSYEFLMGARESAGKADADDPPHTVRITRPFYIGMHEVTVGNFKAFVRATGQNMPGGVGYDPATRQFRVGSTDWQNPGWPQTDRHPVVNVSWEHAAQFCRWLSQTEGKRYRLPTEAEWEYACRAGTTTRFYSGDDEAGLKNVANVADASFKNALSGIFNQPNYYDYTAQWNDGFPFTAPVGSFEPNRFGLYDMHGNVQEWCADWYGKDYYLQSPREDPQGPTSGQTRVKRGGDWVDYLTIHPSSFRRSEVPPTDLAHFLGFRVAMDP